MSQNGQSNGAASSSGGINETVQTVQTPLMGGGIIGGIPGPATTRRASRERESKGTIEVFRLDNGNWGWVLWSCGEPRAIGIRENTTVDQAIDDAASTLGVCIHTKAIIVRAVDR